MSCIVTKNPTSHIRGSFYAKYIKRIIDLLIAFFAIVLLAPVFFIVFILSKIFIGGKVVFKQYRPGKDGKIFALYKFRSMTNKTDKDGILLPDSQRITNYGKIIRKLSLDELPQLYNILIGDMSVVGPRPRLLEECIFLDIEDFKHRTSVRPGLTGLAQINGRNAILFDKVVTYDKQYIETINLWTDISIFIKTFAKVFKKTGVNKRGTVSNEFYGDMLLRKKIISKATYKSKIELAKKLTYKDNLVFDQLL